MLETAGTSFLLLIAVKWFEFDATAKALIAMGGSLGLLAGPLIVSLVENRRWHTSHAAAVLAGLGSACYLVMALAQNATAFVIGAMLVAALSAGAIPLATQIYQENYPKAQRGQLFSRTAMIRIASVAVFSYLAGLALNANAQGMLEMFPSMADLYLRRGICLCFILFFSMPFPSAQGVWRDAPVSVPTLCARG